MELQVQQETRDGSVDAVDTLMDILDDTPLLPGEDPEDYRSVHLAIMSEVKPSTALDYVLMRELVACVYDERRYRRLRENYILSKLASYLEEALKKAIPFDAKADAEADKLNMYRNDYASYLARNWGPGFSDIRKIVERILDAGGLSYDQILASAVSRYIDTIHGFETLIDHAVRGRNRVIAEFERRKDKKRALIEKMSAIAGEVKQ
jgi:hypothetical protein